MRNHKTRIKDRYIKHFLGICPRVNATICSGYAIKQQAITWTDVDQDLWRLMASLGDTKYFEYRCDIVNC